MKKYRINEIFYSLQGEGRWAGRAAIFIRFSGCNLHCPFCDTDFKEFKEMTFEEIVAELSQYKDCKFIVLTGGEPTLQADATFVQGLKDIGYYIAMETNGTREPSVLVDWVTASPKAAYVSNGTPTLVRADEVKIVFDGEHEVSDYGIAAREYYLQPCDTGDKEKNAVILTQCIEYIKAHPKWKLSLQQQKIINVK